MKYYANTDIGKKRTSNQDTFCIRKFGERALLCAVFDGMGGHAGGETASFVAREVFFEIMSESLDPKIGSDGSLDLSKTQIFNIMQKAAQNANTAVFDMAARKPELSGMGTTLAAVLVVGDICYCLNIGDSRIYEIKDGSITQISRDHSYVQYLIDLGEITAEEAKTNLNKSIITRAVGTQETVEGDTFVINAEGATLLLCSDGLSNLVPDSVMLDIITSNGEPNDAVGALIKEANEQGGTDNITAILVRV